jgi:hypothetical protein
MNEYSFNLSEWQFGCQEELKIFPTQWLNNIICFISDSYSYLIKYKM